MESPKSDLLLLYRVREKHDREAFGELYNTYITAVFRFVLLKVSHREEAEDLTAEIFTKAWQHLTSASASEVRHFRAFIYKIARNAIIDFYRTRAKKGTDAIEVAENIPDDRQNILTKLDIASDVDMLVKAIRQLKQEYQDVLFLRYVEDMSISDIARALEKNQTAVRVTLHRAVKKLETVISRQPTESVYDT
jgi:RNA polymerase sigma-70 factor (ECF subfamily)